MLGRDFDAKTILVDAGPTLNGILIERGLVDKISLLLHPFLVGKKSGKLFENFPIRPVFFKFEVDLASMVVFYYPNGRLVIKETFIQKESSILLCARRAHYLLD